MEQPLYPPLKSGVFANVKVGDQFHELFSGQRTGKVITVLEITHRGFKYSVNWPHNTYPIHPRLGMGPMTGGELFINERNINPSYWDSLYERAGESIPWVTESV